MSGADRVRGAADELTRLLSAFDQHAGAIQLAASRIDDAFKNGRKLLLFGNGGSSSQAQHIAAEFVNRFMRERRALPAIALTTDQAILTSIGNDSGFDSVFARQIEAIGCAGDVVLALSTSGSSPNVIAGLDAARSRQLCTIGLTGRSGGAMSGRCDILIQVDSSSTPRIQEMHLLIGHLIAELVEDSI